MASHWTVISLGGSIIVPDNIDVAFLRRLKTFVLALPQQRIAIICGGGETNRTYNRAALRLGAPTSDDLDWIGIRALTLNAELVRSMFGKRAYPKVVMNPAELRTLPKEKVTIGAAFKPGSSSDLDAVLWAKRVGAKTVLNLSNVSHVYTADPRKDKTATPLHKLRWAEFFKIIGTKYVPRGSWPFDPTAAKLAKQYGIAVYIMDGRNLPNVKRALAGKSFVGTVIHA